LGHVRALVVSANAKTRASLTSLIAHWAIKTTDANDADAGLVSLRSAAAEGRPFDLVIVDTNLGGVDQLAFIRLVRAEFPTGILGVIALTVQHRRERPDGVDQADGWVTKPVRGSAMFDCLMNALHPALRLEVDAALTPAPASEPAPSANGHVLVVEDNRVNQKVAVAVLNRLGYSADTAIDGIEALDAMRHHRYDLVLMDCQMPRMDGYETTVEIRSRERGVRHTPIVAMTASAMLSDRDRCLEVGMDDYLTKPLDSDALAAVLRALINAENSAAGL
jgi:CheY-like chemotaxis protein